MEAEADIASFALPSLRIRRSLSSVNPSSIASSFSTSSLVKKGDVYPGAVVLPNRSAGDVGCSLFSYLLYRFATVWLDTMRWQPQLGWMGVDGRGSREDKVIRYWLTLVSGLGTAYT